jgi:hypothetical protein
MSAGPPPIKVMVPGRDRLLAYEASTETVQRGPITPEVTRGCGMVVCACHLPSHGVHWSLLSTSASPGSATDG